MRKCDVALSYYLSIKMSANRISTHLTVCELRKLQINQYKRHVYWQHCYNNSTVNNTKCR